MLKADITYHSLPHLSPLHFHTLSHWNYFHPIFSITVDSDFSLRQTLKATSEKVETKPKEGLEEDEVHELSGGGRSCRKQVKEKRGKKGVAKWESSNEDAVLKQHCCFWKILSWERHKSSLSLADTHSCAHAFADKLMRCKRTHPHKLKLSNARARKERRRYHKLRPDINL